jgi:hypothetical protein
VVHRAVLPDVVRTVKYTSLIWAEHVNRLKEKKK